MTILPLGGQLSARTLPVAAVKAQPAVDDYPATWVVSLDATEEAFLTAPADPGRAGETPFDAVVVYPASGKGVLKADQTVNRDLPRAEGCSAQTLWAAVDLEPDGRADGAIFRFCCDRPEVPTATSGPSPCESNCQAIFSRDLGKPWGLAYQSSED